MDWSEVLPPPELTDFLRVIKLQQFGYDVKLAALGYDDVDDFANFDEAARGRLRAALEGDKVPGGHVDKILRAVAARAAPPSSQLQLQPPPPPASSASSSAGSLPFAAMPPPAAVVHDAAAMHDAAHAARLPVNITAAHSGP